MLGGRYANHGSSPVRNNCGPRSSQRSDEQRAELGGSWTSTEKPLDCLGASCVEQHRTQHGPGTVPDRLRRGGYVHDGIETDLRVRGKIAGEVAHAASKVTSLCTTKPRRHPF